MPKKKTAPENVMKAASKALKLMIEATINNSVHNPRITITGTCTDGAEYELVFNRTDIDKLLDEGDLPVGN